MTTIARVEAFAPATSANLGVGFDILGMAIGGLGDRVIAERQDEPGIVIADITGDDGQLPLDAEKNTAGIAVRHYLTQAGINEGVRLIIHKGLPLASGLGGSAASAVAGVVATNHLFGSPLRKEELLPACLEGEALIGGYHADNVAPSLLGGITLISNKTFEVISQLPVPEDLYLALVTPDVQVPTAEARAVLPEMIPFKSMVSQTSSVARLIDAFYRGDLRAVGKVMGEDTIIEPARAHLMPKFAEVRAAALKAGALSLVISGAGPTLCACCESKETASQVASHMEGVYNESGIACMRLVTQVDERGAYVVNGL